MTDDSSITVIKVGGSLFDLPDLKARIGAVIELRTEKAVCLVSGGGAAADVVRRLQPVHDLSDRAAHRIAMESMRVGEALLCELIPRTRPARSRGAAIEACQAGQIPIIQASEFVPAHEPTRGDKLSRSWSATSDSVAAWIAQTLGADELLLLKSVPPPGDAVDSDVVDPDFRKHALEIGCISWCNLREDPLRVVSLK